MDDAASRSRSDLALDEVRRGLAEQSAALEALRTRAVGLLAVVGIVTGFAGPRTDASSRWALVGGVVLLLGMIGWVLVPRRFSTTVRASVVLDDDAWQLPAVEATDHVVRYLGRSFDANEMTLDRLNRFFLAGMILTGVLTAALLLTQ